MGVLQELLREFTSVEYVEIAHAGTITATNGGFARHVGLEQPQLAGRSIGEVMTAADAEQVIAWAAGATLPPMPRLLNFVASSNQPYTLRCIAHRTAEGLVLVGETTVDATRDATAELLRINNAFATMARELTSKTRELERTKSELESALQELETSYWHLRKIQEVLPVCMGCGQIKGDGAEWQSVVDYLAMNRIFMSHGYCPPCAETQLASFDESEPE